MADFYHQVSDFRVGQRVELHPALDAWVAGDRYGTVERVGRSIVFVRTDKTNRLRWLRPESLAIID